MALTNNSETAPMGTSVVVAQHFPVSRWSRA